MGKIKFGTVAEIADFVKEQVEVYRKFPAKKDEVVEALRPIFSIDFDPWKTVIDGGEFLSAFKSSLGKKRMGFLKELLYTLDEATYQKVDFTIK